MEEERWLECAFTFMHVCEVGSDAGGADGLDHERLDKRQGSCQKWLCSDCYVQICMKVEADVGPIRPLI